MAHAPAFQAHQSGLLGDGQGVHVRRGRQQGWRAVRCVRRGRGPSNKADSIVVIESAASAVLWSPVRSTDPGAGGTLHTQRSLSPRSAARAPGDRLSA